MNARSAHADDVIPKSGATSAPANVWPDLPPDLGSRAAEYFWRLLVVAVGVGLGTVVAFIAALVLGWIAFDC